MEDGECWPSSDYAVSKLDAERRLIALSDDGTLRNVVILRLVPVYDREWSLNLERRVFAPKKVAYLRFGSGLQRMSALARPNLVEFIRYLLEQNGAQGLRIFNVCDTKPYSFTDIIGAFRQAGRQPLCPVIPVPLSPVWLATRLAGSLFRSNRAWWHACYDKLAGDLIYDNSRMLATGFKPCHSLATIFGAKG